MFEQWQDMEPLDYVGEAFQALATARHHLEKGNNRDALDIACLAINRAAHAIQQDLCFGKTQDTQDKAMAALALAESLSRLIEMERGQ